MKLFEFLGFAKRRNWQELVGLRPHMIDGDAADSGYGKRKTYEIQSRIAIIDVRGLLVNDEDWWDGYGFSTYDRITEEIRGASDDPSVDGILLRVNSPGGEMDKAFETAGEIIATGKKKPCWAVAETAAYSAGYLLASAASRVYVPPYTGGVGSIGVYSVHLDYSGYLEAAGIKSTFIEAGKGKTDGHPYKPLPAAAKERMQKEIDRLYGMFVDHVAAQRGIPAGTIREFGARIMPGPEAIGAGLADRVGNTRTVLAEMREHLDTRASIATVPGSSSAATAAKEEVPIMASSNIETPAPAPAATETPAPTAAAPPTSDPDPVVAERQASANKDRIIALCSIAGLSAADARKFIADGRTAEQVEVALLDRRAAASASQDIVSQLQPHTAASAETTNPNESALVKAAEQEAARYAQAGKDR